MKRSYQCFICGVLFDEYSKMAGHVKENHELGREYVVCPLERCQAPVRDLRIHFKANHPYDALPKASQMRALVLFDPKSKKVKKIPSFKEGYITSVKNNGKKMHFRSGWEKDVYESLEALKSVVAYEVEPFGVSYIFEGESKTYWPDLKVYFSDGTVQIWEVKPANQSLVPRNQAKWASCERYCMDRGWKFSVIMEEQIKALKDRVIYEQTKP